MAFKLLARTRENTDTVGTGAINLTGARAPNNRTFASQMSEGDTTFACALSSDGLAWEEGLYTMTGGDLVRTGARLANHLGTTANVSLNGGRIFGIIPSDLLGTLALLLDAGAGTDGYVIAWNDTAGAFELVEQTGGGGGDPVGVDGWHPPCQLATTGALAANTYANGTAGVGATLTGNSNGAIANIDGIAVVAGYRVLVTHEANTTHNGVYVVTQVGDGSHPYILTRAADFNSSSNIDQGHTVPVGIAGVANGLTIWQFYTADTSITLGTTDINFEIVGVRNSQGLDLVAGATQGTMLTRGATGWEGLAPGDPDQLLAMNGTGDGQTYVDAPSGGAGDVVYADINDAGIFANTTSYQAGDIVFYRVDGNQYLCKQNVSTTSDLSDNWDPTQGGAAFTISSDGLTATNTVTNALATILATKAHVGVDIYFEATYPTTADIYFGVAPAGLANTALIGNTGNGIGLNANGNWRTNSGFTASGLGTLVAGHVYGFCVRSSGAIWVADITANPSSPTWYGNGVTGSPTANTNGKTFTAITDMRVAATTNGNGSLQSFPYQDGSGTFLIGTVPSGFTPSGGSAGTIATPDGDPTHWAKVSRSGRLWSPQFSVGTVPTRSGTGLSTNLNLNSSTVADIANTGIRITGVGTSGDSMAAAAKATIGSKFRMRALINFSAPKSNYQNCGFGLRDTSGGKIVSWQLDVNATTLGLLSVSKWNSTTSYNGTYFQIAMTETRFWVEIEVTASNIIFRRASMLGDDFVDMLTTTKTDWLAAINQVVFYTNNTSTSNPNNIATMLDFYDVVVP